MFQRYILQLILIIGIYSNSNAQANLAHEVGITLGPVAFQSDYGERHDFETNTGNTGFGIGFIHYLNFSSRADFDRYFNSHFKVRSEFSYSSTDLKHFGKWVDEGNNSIGKQQLRAMSGSSKIINIGSQLEFYTKNIHDFENTVGLFNPYLSVGVLYSIYNAKAVSTLGPLGNTTTTFPKYLVPSDGRPFGFSNETKGTLSLTAGAGIRYKLSPMSDILVDLRFQYFTSDWVDGLNPNKEIFTENKSNDWNVWFNMGYIFYLDF